MIEIHTVYIMEEVVTPVRWIAAKRVWKCIEDITDKRSRLSK